LTCLDAAKAIGPALRAYAGVILASATLGPRDFLARACGLDTLAPVRLKLERATALPGKLGTLTKRETARLNVHLTEERNCSASKKNVTRPPPPCLRASTPWREKAYDVAYDLRVDTTFQQRSQHYATTAATVEALHAAAAMGYPPGPARWPRPPLSFSFRATATPKRFAKL